MSDSDERIRISVRSCQKPNANLKPARSLELIGGNQGNLLYQFSTLRALSSDSAQLKIVKYSGFDRGNAEERAEKINSEADHLVLPLSSSFRLQMLDTLNHWADVVERLTIPVTVVGIGAQLRLQDVAEGVFLPSRVTGISASRDQVSAHEAAARRFTAAVLDRSVSIGVRGEVSKNYLSYLGFPADRIDVIGCPSLFMWGADFRMPEPTRRRPTRRSAISMSFDHRISDSADILEQTARTYRRSTIYAQEKLTAQMVVEDSDTRPGWGGDPRFPVQTSNRLYRGHRMVYYPTAWSWIEYLKTQDFAFGPRLHGTIAAMLAGTPAHLLVHDSRTLEIAEYHGLPFTLTDDLGSVKSIGELFQRQSYQRFNELYPERFAAFLTFLKRNGLPNAYEGDNQALAHFDASVEAAAHASGVVSRGPRNPIRRAAKRVRAARRALAGAMS